MGAMLRAVLAATVAALAVSAAVPAAPARSELVVVPGKSMGGVKLGDTFSTVRRVYGKQYFPAPNGPNYREILFRVPDLIVRLRSEKVVALISSADNLRTNEGLAVGQPIGRIKALYGTLPTVHCDVAVLHVIRGATSATYIGTYGGKVAGIDIALRSEAPCDL
jgi:hypothetical protein